MKIRPLNENLVVKPIVKEEVSKSGIVLPDTLHKEGPKSGEVIAIGEGKLLENGQRAQMSVKVGDKILYKNSYSSEEIKIENEKYSVISQDDVLGILE